MFHGNEDCDKMLCRLASLHGSQIARSFYGLKNQCRQRFLAKQGYVVYFASLLLEALHTSGVITNNNLNPLSLDSKNLSNVFFTGRNLSHWNPSIEFSSEGVSIASGWFSANNIARIIN